MIVNHDAPVIYAGWYYADNYWHWMYDCFPAVLWLRKHRPDFNDKPIAVPAVAINRRHVVEWGQLVNAKYVVCEGGDESGKVVVRWPRRFTMAPHITVVDLYREFLPSRTTQTKHLMIARKCRQIRNAGEVVDLFAKRGIKLEQVYFEDHSIREQMALAASAKSIIGIHGAGLANITYCSPGTKVVEVWHNIYCCQYRDMSRLMGFPYKLVNSDKMDMEGNVEVDPEAVFCAWQSL